METYNGPNSTLGNQVSPTFMFHPYKPKNSIESKIRPLQEVNSVKTACKIC